MAAGGHGRLEFRAEGRAQDVHLEVSTHTCHLKL
jgi:hypothetical protein